MKKNGSKRSSHSPSLQIRFPLLHFFCSNACLNFPSNEFSLFIVVLVDLYHELDLGTIQRLTVRSEKQLKHRLQKWDINKNIPTEDMKTMVSLKRKRQALGKTVNIKYKGHDADQEKLDRADKRFKSPLGSPIGR